MPVQSHPPAISNAHAHRQTSPPAHAKTDLGNEDQTECDGATKDDHQSYNAKLDIGLIPGQKRHCSTDYAHDANVVDAHSDVFAVIESRNAHIPGFPGQETAKQLQGKTQDQSDVVVFENIRGGQRHRNAEISI